VAIFGLIQGLWEGCIAVVRCWIGGGEVGLAPVTRRQWWPKMGGGVG